MNTDVQPSLCLLSVERTGVGSRVVAETRAHEGEERGFVS